MSQESLRFVRLDDLGLWLPPEIEQDPELVNLFERTFEDLEQLQLELAKKTKIDSIKDFDLKKKLTSSFRRIAPDGLATTIGFTANARAWRRNSAEG
jgi:thymidylate synthase (FAD)